MHALSIMEGNTISALLISEHVLSAQTNKKREEEKKKTAREDSMALSLVT